MKNKFLLGILAFTVAIFTVATLSAFDKPDETKLLSEAEYANVGTAAIFNYRLDTITNAESNTLTIGNRDNTVWNTVTTPANFISLYTYDVKVKVAALSGTTSIKVALDACNVTSGTSTGWVGIDSLTTTAVTTIQLRSTDATATRYRLRVIGSGTQSSTYQVWTAWKKKN